VPGRVAASNSSGLTPHQKFGPPLSALCAANDATSATTLLVDLTHQIFKRDVIVTGGM
jgi:hypothetical protein